MKIKYNNLLCLILFLVSLTLASQLAHSQKLKENPELDAKVKSFLNDTQYSWQDMNVPAVDGQLLFDIIVKNGYKNAVEIGTSTGHSGMWIAWALSKTGGKLITLEIDKRRFEKALDNFKRAGLYEYIDARLCDAHKEVPRLKGQIDFVFSDADKGWYTNYFKDISPKIENGGCFVAHNISQQSRQWGISEFVDYIESQTNFKTTYDTKGSGISISYKISDN